VIATILPGSAPWRTGFSAMNSSSVGCEIVLAFEDNMLVGKTGMLPEVRTEARFISSVDEVDGAAKDGVFDAFMVRQVQTTGETWLSTRLLGGPNWGSRFRGRR